MTLDELRATAEPGRGGYRVFGGAYAQMSVTLEDAEWLYALVRLTKPARVVELGTGLGISARFIAEALAENGSGQLVTIEPNHYFSELARESLAGLPCEVLEKFRGVFPQPDLLFIDSGYERRASDIQGWMTNGYEGILVVHDANRDYEALRGRGVLIPGVDGMWIGRGDQR